MVELTYTFRNRSSASPVFGFEHFLKNPSEYNPDSWDDEVKDAYNLVKNLNIRIEMVGKKTVKISSRIDIPGLESALILLLKQLYDVEFSAPGSIKF